MRTMLAGTCCSEEYVLSYSVSVGHNVDDSVMNRLSLYCKNLMKFSVLE